MITAAKVAGPILIVGLSVGLAISLIQSVTQIQEITLTFVPKLAAVAAVIVGTGSWMLRTLVNFTQQIYEMIPTLIGKT
jgi:flagellar biosynthetic protein FliQ